MNNYEALFINYLSEKGVCAFGSEYINIPILSKENFSSTYARLCPNKTKSVFIENLASLSLAPVLIKGVKFFGAVLSLETIYTESELLKCCKVNTLFVVPIIKENLDIDNIDKTRYNINLFSWCKLPVKYVFVNLSKQNTKLATNITGSKGEVL